MRVLKKISNYFGADRQAGSLEEDVARYRRIFDGGRDYGFVDWDLDNDVLNWHGGFWQMLGYSEKDVAQISKTETFLSYVHPDDRDMLMEKVRNKLRTSVKEGATFRVKSKEGTYRWTEIRVDTLRDSEGWVKYVSGLVFDVSVLKNTEQALMDSEARYARIIQSSDDGIWEWSAVADGGFYFSSRCWEMLGFSREDLITDSGSDDFKFWRERIHPEDAANFDQAVQDHVVDGKPYDMEYRVQAKSGEWRWIRTRGQMSFNDLGEPYLMSGKIMDVTNIKNSEQKVLEAKDSAEKANKAKSEFLSAMSHELRTPLNAILGFAQLFDLDHNLTEDQRDNVLEIKNAGRHLLKLVGDVLDLAKIEAGRTELNIESVYPGRIIRSCINLVTTLAERRDVSIKFNERSFEDYVIQVDPIRIKQVFLNLISNAIKYNRKSGEVKIFCDVSNQGVMKISVEDTGKGIPVSHQGELFQPFNRLGAEKSNIEGSGVGLVITKELTEQMGGELGYKTAKNIGTTFWVSFPICSEKEVADNNESSPEAIAVMPELLVHEEKNVLYIEDNPSNQRLMSQLLAKFPVLNIKMANQALEGLFLARTESPDLVILDINLPGMNGYEVVEVLKKDPLTQTIPVIALSANALSHDVEKGKEAGFDFYLTKPVDLAELIEVCNSLLA